MGIKLVCAVLKQGQRDNVQGQNGEYHSRRDHKPRGHAKHNILALSCVQQFSAHAENDEYRRKRNKTAQQPAYRTAALAGQLLYRLEQKCKPYKAEYKAGKYAKSDLDEKYLALFLMYLLSFDLRNIY